MFLPKSKLMVGPWRNRKTGEIYQLCEELTNTTNAQNGQVLMVYQNKEGEKFARELVEFLMKFTPIES